jgi:tetratricopeptide (TPR) repeat protein
MICFKNSFKFYSLTFYIFICFTNIVNAQAKNEDLIAAQKKQSNDALYFDAVRAKILGEEKQQEALLQKFIKERPEVAAAYFDLATIALNSNRISDAEANIKRAIELDKENIWYRESYADVLKRQKKFGEAADVYNDLAKKSTYSRNYYFEAAINYQRAQKYKESLAVLDKLMETTYADDLILMQKQEVYLQMNDLDGALKIAQNLVDRNPKDGRYLANLAELLSNNNKPEMALEVYQSAIKKFPDEPSLQMGLAEHFKKKKDTAKYDEYFTKTVLNPNLDETSQVMMMQSYLMEVGEDSSRRSGAVAIAKKLVEQQPESALMQALYGGVMARNDQPEEAATYLKKALDQDPSQYDLWQELLTVYIRSNNADSLISSSKRALRYFPNNAIIHYFNGIGYINMKEYIPAIKSLTRAIELQPEDNTLLLGDMYSSLGDAYNFVKQFALSDSSYDKALSFNKDNASVLNNYSYYLSVRGIRLDQAEKMSKRSLEIRPNEATFLDTYAWVLYKQGKYKEAKEYIDQAIKANPRGDGTLYEHLGDIYFKLNEIDKAVESWKVAKERGADDINLIDKKIQDRRIYE